MTVSKLKFIVGSMVILTSVPLMGQKDSFNSEIGELDFMISNWEVNNYSWVDKDWLTIGKTRSTIKSHLDGKFITETVEYKTSFGDATMTIFIGYDSRLKRFKLCAMDKEFGLMDIYVGYWIEDELVFDNIRSDTPIRLDDKKKLSFRLTYSNLESNSFEHLVEGTYDSGKTWFPFARSVYKK